MTSNRTFKYLGALAVLGCLWSCGSRNQWKVQGEITGADSQPVIVEMSENGYWFPLDTVTTDKSGKFTFSHDRSGYPDIYRLTLDGKSIYFPIDSTETVTVNSNAADFDKSYTVTGSNSADMMASVDNKIKEVAQAKGIDAAVNDSVLKRELGGMILSNPDGIVSYYIINKKLNGKPIFNPADNRDIRIIGAVANAYNEFRPLDPRTKYLRTLFLSNRPASQSAPSDTIQVKELNFFEIGLTDNKGVEHKLSESVNRNKVVVLNFTAYGAEQSPSFNMELAKVYEQYHSKGLEIYQVSVDPDEYLWKQTAKNLPWITVYNPSTNSEILRKYNVTGIPTIYILANGELVKRVDDVTRLSSAVSPYL